MKQVKSEWCSRSKCEIINQTVMTMKDKRKLVYNSQYSLLLSIYLCTGHDEKGAASVMYVRNYLR